MLVYDGCKKENKVHKGVGLLNVGDVTTISWILLFIGIVLAIVSLFFDIEGIDVLSIGCFVTVYGGSSLIVSTMTEQVVMNVCISLGMALLLTAFVHFFIVPMKKTEATIAFHTNDLVGKKGKVITEIPATGLGEILIHTGLGVHTCSAASFDGIEMTEGSDVLVIEFKEHIAYVSSIDENEQ